MRAFGSPPFRRRKPHRAPSSTLVLQSAIHVKGVYTPSRSRTICNMKALAEHDGYTATEVEELTGATYRQIDYWSRRGLLGTEHLFRPGSGNRRTFSDDDARLVRLLMDAYLLGARDSYERISRCYLDAGSPECGYVLLLRDVAIWVPEISVLEEPGIVLPIGEGEVRQESYRCESVEL